MPPKNSTRKEQEGDERESEANPKEPMVTDQKEVESDESNDSANSRKRKRTDVDDGPNKASKTKPRPSQVQIVKFLLSEASADFCRPEDECRVLEEQDKDLITYSDLLSPFEELICAVILSRPISHRLGLRTIRTILNPPYSFEDVDSIREAGAEKIHEALEDARTQHKGKTAEEIALVADAISTNEWDSDLKNLREDAKKNVKKEREMLRSSIKGLGPTGLDIFYRRIQWLWDEVFPFIDKRTSEALGKLGLPVEAEDLRNLIKDNWDALNAPNKEEDRAENRAFVQVLERAISADLEKKVDQLLEKASGTDDE